MKRFYEKLLEYGVEGAYPLHMPGHKRNGEILPAVDPYAIDITEIEGFDDLHHAEGPLREAMVHAAQIFGSERTHFLVNGSTGGVLAAVSALADRGDKVIMARNCHLSAYHAVFLREAEPVYLYPQTITKYGITGAVAPDQLAQTLQRNPDAACVILTSPTYEGVVSDIAELAQIAHQYNVPLIVDEAHGSHFGFHPLFPPSSVAGGADVVIHGLHKTLPAFTQSALLHVSGDLVPQASIEKYLSIYQSSSPSYILMYGIDRCMWFLQESGPAFDAYAESLQKTYRRLGAMKNLALLHQPKDDQGNDVVHDPSKIVVMTDRTSDHTPLTGLQLSQRLRQAHDLQLEMAALHYVVAMTSVGDKASGLQRLAEALLTMDAALSPSAATAAPTETNASTNGSRQPIPLVPSIKNETPPPLPIHMNPREAHRRKGRFQAIGDLAGETAKEMAYLYPPGIPLMVPGEGITKECVETMLAHMGAGYEIRGPRYISQKKVEVVDKT